jgi:3-hydroxy-5-methyl-1-naphthoate 3-O-methyltransferase
MTALPATSDDAAFWDIWLTPYYFPCVTVADEVGTFAAISGEALTTEALAAKLDVNARALGIHLCLLSALGMVERREGKWRSTALARTWMHPEGEGYYGPMIRGYRESLPLHGQMMETLKTGNVAEGHGSNVKEWERGVLPQDMADRIAAFMNAHSVASSKAVARIPEMANTASLLDVGAGSGVFCIEAVRANAQLSATVLEIDTMCIAAQRYIDKAGLSERISTTALNMFETDWPKAHDAHFFSNIFHDWSAETNRLLARKSFDALPKGGMIMLHEILLNDDHTGPLAAAAFSMLMLLGTRGKQYSLSEYRDILESAGFVDVQAQRTGGGYYSLVTAMKPGA